MSFKSIKEKGFTRIVFRRQERWRSGLFILFLWLQSLLVYTGGLFYRWIETLFLFSCVLSTLLSVIVLLELLLQKSLKLTHEGFSIEYSLLGLLLYRRCFAWNEVRKAAVEQSRLKTHDILFVTQGKSVFLHEALSEADGDALLREIQLFHHYKV